MKKPKQLSVIFEDCLESFNNDKPKFLSMLEEHLNIDSLVPLSFSMHFYKSTGRPHGESLISYILSLIIQRIFSIPSDSLLILFLTYSRDLRDFCGFDKVPDQSQITRFKQDYKEDLKTMFDNLVDLTEPICQNIDSELASMTIFDTSGIEAYVKENNPKFVDGLIKKLKAWKAVKGLDNSYDPYKAAYALMPTHADAEPAIKQMYINGHFCYSYKFGLITNGLGIVRDIAFYDENYYRDHPEIPVSKKEDSPDEDKSLSDAKALLPTLRDFHGKHPLIKPSVFLGDSAFDSIDIYNGLLGEGGLGYTKAFIPLNSRSHSKYPDCSINEDGIPCCPNDPTLPMKPESGVSNLRSGIPRFKFVCPKMSWKCEEGKNVRRTSCENPCTDSLCGRMLYVYPEKDLRTYPGTVRGTKEWDDTYKIRVTVEKSINHFKDSFCISGRKTRDKLTSESDLYLAGITQLVTVLLADSIHQRQYIRSLKPLICA
jgi:hypothetical protein